MITLRARIYYLLIVIIVTVLGMGSRVFADSLPLFISIHFGDGLWSSMIYFGVRTIWVDKKLHWAFWISLIFTFSIEFSQLYKAEWLIGIRNSFLGALVLGKGFLGVDLVRYSVGIIISYWIDRCISKQSSKST